MCLAEKRTLCPNRTIMHRSNHWRGVPNNRSQILGKKKKNWKIDHKNDLRVYSHFSASRSILMLFSTIWWLVVFQSSLDELQAIWCHSILTECLRTFWKFYEIIRPFCSNTHIDIMLHGTWSKMYWEATRKKIELKTWNNISPNLSLYQKDWGKHNW